MFKVLLVLLVEMVSQAKRERAVLSGRMVLLVLPEDKVLLVKEAEMVLMESGEKLVNKEHLVLQVHQVSQVPPVNVDSKVTEVLMAEMGLKAIRALQDVEDQLVNEELLENVALMGVTVEMD